MISSVIQNEIIDVIGNLVIKKIVERVKMAKYYSILCDETTDVSTLEQMTIWRSLCRRNDLGYSRRFSRIY